MPIIAVSFFLILLIVAVVVDLSRMHLVRSKAQNAADAALLGGASLVPTGGASSPTAAQVTAEATRLYRLNFPANYMGSSGEPAAATIAASTGGSVTYELRFPVTVPTMLIHLLNNIYGNTSNAYSMEIVSRVRRGFGEAEDKQVELSMALDNTGSMSISSKIEGLRQASTDLVNIIFESSATLPNVHISIVPYDVSVRVLGRPEWVQAAYLPLYGTNPGFISNRNRDLPITFHSDATDAPPTDEATKFRTPWMNPSGVYPPGFIFPGSCLDWPATALGGPPLRPITFASNNRAALLNDISLMVAVGCTRVPVGLMWSWFTLSPRWKGIWDAARPELPKDRVAFLQKVAVLMTDGQNTAYAGLAPGSNTDNAKLIQICNAMKADGIVIYTIAFGSDAEQNLLRSCATDAAKFFYAPTNAQIQQAFQIIANNLVYPTVRLVQ